MVSISREQLEEKLAGLKDQEEQILAQLNAVSGAIALCREFLAQLSETGD